LGMRITEGISSLKRHPAPSPMEICNHTKTPIKRHSKNFKTRKTRKNELFKKYEESRKYDIHGVYNIFQNKKIRDWGK